MIPSLVTLSRTMSLRLTRVSNFAAFFFALVSAAGTSAQDKAQESVAELFRSRCLACHVPPDPRFEVERAWLSQVHDTA